MHRSIALGLAGLLLPWSCAIAVGLGKLTVLSAVGQPLAAEIEIISLQPREAESASARLAPSNAFRQANIELSSALLSARFAVEARAGGRHIIRVTSTEPVTEPFVEMLVELSSANARLVREYTFLLDPPEYKRAVVPPAAPKSPEAQSLPEPRLIDKLGGVPPAAPQVQPLPAEAPRKATPSVPVAAPAAAALRMTGAHRVKRGETLSKIALATKPDGATLPQMLAALYRANQEAFIANNMNRLRTGRVLNIPDRNSVLSVSAEDARRLVAAQSGAHDQLPRSIGIAVAAAPERAPRDRQSAGRIGDPAEADKALKEAQDRIAMLEKKLADLHELVQLQSEADAQLQRDAAAKAPEAAKPKAASKSAPPPPTPSLVDDLLERIGLLIGTLVAVIVLVAGYAAYAWRRQKKAALKERAMGDSRTAPVSGGARLTQGEEIHEETLVRAVTPTAQGTTQVLQADSAMAATPIIGMGPGDATVEATALGAPPEAPKKEAVEPATRGLELDFSAPAEAPTDAVPRLAAVEASVIPDFYLPIDGEAAGKPA